MLVVWLLFTLLVFNRCSEQLCTGCETDGTLTDVTDTSQLTRYPIDFQWSDPTAFTNDGFETFKQSILERGKGIENGVLEITGLYYEDEPKPAGFENMGFARAAQAKALFGDGVDSIYLRAQLVEEKPGIRTGYFEAARFDWITNVAEGVLESDERSTADTETESTVPDIPTSTVIRFPFGSTQRVEDPAVETYLNRLAERIQQTSERVTLTGHTDNVGEEVANLTLGRNRANAIRNLLIRKGVSQDLITVDSKGESQPTDTNETEEGRHNNRRVEVRVIEQ